MLVAETVASLDLSPIRFAVIGTCRVHGPIRAAIQAGLAKPFWQGFNAFTHNPYEALQYLQHARGERPVPDSFAPYIFSTAESPIVDAKLIDSLGQIDLLLVEASTFTRIGCGGYEFQQNYFSEHFIRKGGVPYLDWWRDVTQGRSGGPAADKLIDEMETPVSLEHEEVLRTLRFQNLSDDDFINGIRHLSEAADAPILLVPHFSFDDADTSISRQRARSRHVVGEAARQLGLDVFDPSDLVQSHGREVALKNEGRDLYHYTPEFDHTVGAALIERVVAMQAPFKRAAAV